LNRRPNNTHVSGLEHGVKAACELAIAIANQNPNRFLPLDQSPRDLPRLLRDPGIVRMCRAAGQVDAAAAEFNEQQHIQSLEPYGVDGEEITAMMLLACVRRNARHDSPRRTVGPSPSARTDLLDSRCRDHDVNALQLADDALIALPRILAASRMINFRTSAVIGVRPGGRL
jgi:hypothetical protein